MIEIIRVRKCDICGKEMPYEHVTITWPEGRKDDVCHDCTRRLNVKLKEMRTETDDNFYVVGFRNLPLNVISWDKPFTLIGKFSGQNKAEVCKEMREAEFDRVVIAKSLDEAVDMLLAEREVR